MERLEDRNAPDDLFGAIQAPLGGGLLLSAGPGGLFGSMQGSDNLSGVSLLTHYHEDKDDSVPHDLGLPLGWSDGDKETGGGGGSTPVLGNEDFPSSAGAAEDMGWLFDPFSGASTQ